MFKPVSSMINLPVYIVIHEWTKIINGQKEESNCEIVAVRYDEASAMRCRDDTIHSICERRKSEKYRIEVRKDSSGDAHIYAQPEKEWFRSYRKDYVTIDERSMPIHVNVLEDLIMKVR